MTEELIEGLGIFKIILWAFIVFIFVQFGGIQFIIGIVQINSEQHQQLVAQQQLKSDAETKVYSDFCHDNNGTFDRHNIGSHHCVVNYIDMTFKQTTEGLVLVAPKPASGSDVLTAGIVGGLIGGVLSNSGKQ